MLRIFYHVWRANILQYNTSGLKRSYMQESISSANFYHGNFNHIPFVPIVFGINIAFRIRIQTFNRICMQQINLLWLVWRRIRVWDIYNKCCVKWCWIFLRCCFCVSFFLTFKSIQTWITILIYMLFHLLKRNVIIYTLENVTWNWRDY